MGAAGVVLGKESAWPRKCRKEKRGVVLNLRKRERSVGAIRHVFEQGGKGGKALQKS